MAQLNRERSKVDHELRRLGFGSLDDPNLIPQIACLIRTHEQFRGQLFSVLPEQRHNAYNSLRPHLPFEAKPLDVYEAEMKLMAEQQQLPTWDGSVYPKPFEVPKITLEKKAEEAIVKAEKENKEHGYLSLVCSFCLKQDVFVGETRKEAAKDAVAKGWRPRYKNTEPHKVIDSLCPECVGSRNVQART